VRWGERTLDLDLLLFGDQVIHSPTLRVPHPRMALRRFVLAPLAQIAPGQIDPVTRRSILGLLQNLDRRPSYVAIAASYSLHEIETVGRWLARAGSNALKVQLFCALRRNRSENAWGLQERLCASIPAIPIDEGTAGRLGESESPPQSLFELSSTLRELKHALGEFHCAPSGPLLDADVLKTAVPAESWLVSPFWFDAVFLSHDSLKSSRPRCLRYREQFLEARSRILPPTFVVARTSDLAKFAIQDPRFEWFRPIGWDTPVLEVDDFESEATVSAVVTTCAATRTG
jgi:hypothetical protein